MAHVEDITDAKQAQHQREAMAQSEKLRALGQMATGIAHDLNQSLMLVASYSDLARQALAQDPPNLVELEDLLTTTTQAALDCGETVKRLLLFTRAAPGRDLQLVDLSKVVAPAWVWRWYLVLPRSKVGTSRCARRRHERLGAGRGSQAPLA